MFPRAEAGLRTASSGLHIHAERWRRASEEHIGRDGSVGLVLLLVAT